MNGPETPGRPAFRKAGKPAPPKVAIACRAITRIKEWLQDQGYNRRWVATNADLSRNTLTKIFGGEQPWKVDGPYEKTVRALMRMPGLPADIVNDLQTLLFMSGVEKMPAKLDTSSGSSPSAPAE